MSELEKLKATWNRLGRDKEWQLNQTNKLVKEGLLPKECLEELDEETFVIDGRRTKGKAKGELISLRISEELLWDLDFFCKKHFGADKNKFRSRAIRELLEEILAEKMKIYGVIPLSEGQFEETKLKQIQRSNFRQYE